MYGVSYQGYEFRLEEYYSQHDPCNYLIYWLYKILLQRTSNYESNLYFMLVSTFLSGLRVNVFSSCKIVCSSDSSLLNCKSHIGQFNASKTLKTHQHINQKSLLPWSRQIIIIDML